MRLAVSSIAWEMSEDEVIAALLSSRGIDAVELAPTKIWPEQIAQDPASVTDAQISKAMEVWHRYSLTPVAMQSMLFLRPDLKIFESSDNREQTIIYLKKFIDLASRMGVARMVFGSPKNRQRGELSVEEANAIAVAFFKELGDYAAQKNVIFCIEPNAPQYACDFVTTAKEGAELVRSVASPGFGLHLDTACMTLAGDDLAASIYDYRDILCHYHISSPMLDAVRDKTDVNHMEASDALDAISYDQIISIEMRPGEAGQNIQRITHAIDFVEATYSVK